MEYGKWNIGDGKWMMKNNEFMFFVYKDIFSLHFSVLDKNGY